MSPRRPATPDEGRAGDPDKDRVDAEQAKQAAAVEASSEEAPTPKPKRGRRKATPQAEGTAAEATGVDKDVAEAALDAPVDSTETEPEPVAEEKPKPRRTRRKAEEDKPAAPAAKQRRAPRDYGDTPPMVRAHAKYVRTSARKARLVGDHIREAPVHRLVMLPVRRAERGTGMRDVA